MIARARGQLRLARLPRIDLLLNEQTLDLVALDPEREQRSLADRVRELPVEEQQRGLARSVDRVEVRLHHHRSVVAHQPRDMLACLVVTT